MSTCIIVVFFVPSDKMCFHDVDRSLAQKSIARKKNTTRENKTKLDINSLTTGMKLFVEYGGACRYIVLGACDATAAPHATTETTQAMSALCTFLVP